MAELSRGQILKNPEVISGVSGVGATIRLQDGDRSAYVDIKCPDTLASSYQLTLPLNDGNSDQVLKTDGSGTLSWSDTPASGSNTQLQYNNSGVFAGAAATTNGSSVYFNAGSGVIFKDSVDLYSQIKHSASSNIDGVNNLVYNLPQHVGLGGSVLKVLTNPVSGEHTLHWAPDLLGEFDSVAGADGSIQYNNGGLHGGSTNLIFDDNTNTIELIGNLFVGNKTSPTTTTVGIATVTTRLAVGPITNTTGEGVLIRTTALAGNPNAISISNPTNAVTLTVGYQGNEPIIRSTGADLNLVNVTSGEIVLDPTNNVTLSGNKSFRFANSGNTQFASFKFNNPTTDYTVTLPATDGIQDDILQRDASGIMQWVDNRRVVNAVFYGGSNPIGSGSTVVLSIPNDCTIIEARLIAGVSDSMTIIVERSTFAATPSWADISNGGQALSSAIAVSNTALTGWTTQLNRGDLLRFRVTTIPTSAVNATLSLILRSR
jgi:hypothetical protein